MEIKFTIVKRAEIPPQQRVKHSGGGKRATKSRWAQVVCRAEEAGRDEALVFAHGLKGAGAASCVSGRLHQAAKENNKRIGVAVRGPKAYVWRIA